MEQLDEKHIYIYAEQLEYAVRRLQNTNENLQSTLDQYKMKIAELEEKDIQSKKTGMRRFKRPIHIMQKSKIW